MLITEINTTLIHTPYSDYKIFSYLQQNNSSVTLFTICVYECLMNMYTKFYFPISIPKLRYGPLTLNNKMLSPKCDHIGLLHARGTSLLKYQHPNMF